MDNEDKLHVDMEGAERSIPSEYQLFEDQVDHWLLDDLAAKMSDFEGGHMSSEDEGSDDEDSQWMRMFDCAKRPVYCGFTKFSLLSVVLQMMNTKSRW